jgi:hypothetical protein
MSSVAVVDAPTLSVSYQVWVWLVGTLIAVVAPGLDFAVVAADGSFEMIVSADAVVIVTFDRTQQLRAPASEAFVELTAGSFRIALKPSCHSIACADGMSLLDRRVRVALSPAEV